MIFKIKKIQENGFQDSLETVLNKLTENQFSISPLLKKINKNNN